MRTRTDSLLCSQAAGTLARLRGHPVDSDFIQDELSEIIANHEYETSIIPQTGYFGSWAACFTGSLWKAESNIRRTILGTSLYVFPPQPTPRQRNLLLTKHPTAK